MVATVQQKIAYEQAAATRLDSSKCLLAAFERLGVPESMTDVGCGPGHLVQIADGLGVWSAGYDIALPKPITRMPGRSALFETDLTDPEDCQGMQLSELVLCWEVAEHIEEEHADWLCQLLSEVTEGTLLFTAAVPGQGGSGHVNEQPHEYWIEKLSELGLTYVWPVTEALRGDFAVAAPRAWWYGRNLMVFRKELR